MWLLVFQLGLLCIGGNTQSMDGLFPLDILGNNSINPVSTHFGMDENVKYYQEHSDFTDFTDFSVNTINLRLCTGDGICKDVYTYTNCVKMSEKISDAIFYWNIIGSFIIIGIMFISYYFSIISNIYYTLPVMFVYILLLCGMSNVNAENIMQKITASDITSGHLFGHSVSVWNDIAVVGAYYDDYNGFRSGSAYIFEKHNEDWIQTEKLVASDGASNDNFGWSVAVYDSIIVVGAFADDNPNGTSCSDCGSAYIFEKGNQHIAWVETKLFASNGAQSDRFGYSVAIYKNFVVIGAYYDDSKAGSAYIFEKVGVSWVEIKQIFASDRSSGDYFGNSVSIHENIVAVGTYSGSVYVFEKNGSTNNWPTYSYDNHKLNALDGAPSDYFGRSVSVYNNTVLVGSYGHDINNKTNSGAAYIFEKIQGSWTQTHKLFPFNGSISDYFGFSVSLFENIALIGSYLDDDMALNSGSAYIFEREINGNWIETEKLVAYDGASQDLFGRSVSIHGNHILVGAYYDDDPQIGKNTGSAYMIESHMSCNDVWNGTTNKSNLFGKIENNYLINYKWTSCLWTDYPTKTPTNNPTKTPTNNPTKTPTNNPTKTPTNNPSKTPTNNPSGVPTNAPTKTPTLNPSFHPSGDPTADPTHDPTIDPTSDPTVDPTVAPSVSPSIAPSISPSIAPSLAPSLSPTTPPSLSPSSSPTYCYNAKYRSKMFINDVLWSDEIYDLLVSNNCICKLKLHSNGNLVIHERVMNKFKIKWETNTTCYNFSGVSVAKFELNSNGLLVINEYAFKNVETIPSKQLWINDNTKMHNEIKNIVLILTDECCLELIDLNIDNIYIDNIIWTNCIFTTTTEILSTDLEIYSSDNIFDNNNSSSKTNSNIKNNLYWIWIIMVLIALIILLLFCKYKHNNNKLWISATIATEMAEITDEDQTGNQIEQWINETNNVNEETEIMTSRI